MNRHLLLLGGGQMQLPAIDWAHRLGVSVVCFDGKPQVLARDLVDHFVVCDIADKELCVQKAREHREAFRLDGVITVGTDFSTTVAWVAQQLGLPGIPYEVALRAKDKGLMRACFAASGVASPQFLVLEQGIANIVTPGFGFPCVVKPSDSMGARGVRLVSGDQELAHAVAEAWAHSPSRRAVVEEFIDGPEFSLDAIVHDGKFERMGLADRTIVFPPHFVEIGHTFPSKANSHQVEALWKEFEKGVRAIGIVNGAAKGDVKLSSRGPVIGEIAARLSGGFMSGWTYPYSSGRSAVLWAVQTALGLPLAPQGEDRFLPVAERAWISLPGVVRSIEGLTEVRQIPGVRDVFVNLSPGRVMVFPTNNVEKAGNVLCVGDSPEAVEETARRARNRLHIVLEPNHPATEEFLFGASPSRWWFFQAAETPETRWWSLAETEGWKDPYGNTLPQIVEGLSPEELSCCRQDSRWARALFKGGVQGVRYLSGGVSG